MRFILSIALLLSVYHNVEAQDGVRECPRITLQDLESRENSLRSSILVQTYNTNVNPTDPFIVVEDMHIVCEAVGTKRDTYRYVSVVVRQKCSGFNCPVDTRDVSTVVQYDFECSITNEWIAEAFGSRSIREDNPEANLDTESLRTCSACARTLAGADPVTHCRPCPSSCNQGLEQCDGLGTDCCNFYFEDKCEEECPEDGHVVDEDFNCVEPVECPELQNPKNGTVTYDERLYPNEAVYECDDELELSGDATRKCQIDGEWAGDAPECEPEEDDDEEEEEEEEVEEDGEGSNSRSISNSELGIVVAVVVLFVLIVIGVFVTFIAVWACKN